MVYDVSHAARGTASLSSAKLHNVEEMCFSSRIK